MKFVARGSQLDINRTLIMAVLNVTPDSFSDGGVYFEKNADVKRGIQLQSLGADIIDIGGESTRPGAEPVSPAEEISRVVPVIRELKNSGIKALISADTYRSSTARAALDAGADIINDISGGTFDPDIMKTAAEYGAGYVIMHIKGSPKDMQKNAVYSTRGAAADISAYFSERIKSAVDIGLKTENLILDPGIGFGKTLNDNFDIIENLGLFRAFGMPVLIGTSRKSMIGEVTGTPPDGRIFGTAATVALAVEKGADIVRVHDVKEMKQAADMAFAFANYLHEVAR
jgi:dihydropteroate synthase